MLVFPCPKCGAKLQMADDLAGKKVRCAGCEAVVTAPNVSEMIEPAGAPGKSRAVTAGKSTARRPDDRDGDDRPRRGSGTDAAATAAAAAGAGIGMLGIMAIVGGVVVVLGCCGVGVVGVALLVPGVQKVRDSAARLQTINNMKQVALAEINRADTFRGVLSPPKMTKQQQQNQPVELSWRVDILPFIEQAPLYNRFDKNAAWDSPVNKILLSPMPMPYQDVLLDADKLGTTDTRFQYFTGPGTLWPDASTTRTYPKDFTAGTSNTFLVAESSNPVPWSKPADMAIQPNVPLPLPPDRFIAAFADASVRLIDRRRAPDVVLNDYLDPKSNKPHQPLD